MFYSLVRSYMGFRKLHGTVQKKKGARCRTRNRKETGCIVDDRQDITTVILDNVTNGLGLCIVEAKGQGQDKSGIYINTVIPGMPADLDGRLHAGDQLLGADGHSFIGISEDQAAAVLAQTKTSVTLKVAKQAANRHGLDQLLNQPSFTDTASLGTRSRLQVYTPS